MAGSNWAALLGAYFWGVFSVLLSPCHLSSIPLIVGFISSLGQTSTRRTFIIAVSFSTGILVTIALIGLLTAMLGRLLGDIGSMGNYVVSGVFLLVGLYLMDIIRLDWNRFTNIQPKSGAPWAVFILGLLFGLALGPCTFAFMAPVLGVVFKTAQSNLLISAMLLLAYAIGHCTLIVLAGTLTGKVKDYLNWTEKSTVSLWIKRVCGTLVLAGGVYFLFNS